MTKTKRILEDTFYILLIISICTSIIYVLFYNAEKYKYRSPGQHIQHTQFSTSQIVTVTTYRAEIEQTDSTPFVTADGSKITSTSTNWCAISDDLFEVYNFGDTINLICVNPKYSGAWIVHDRMNSRYKNYVDCLVVGVGGLWIGRIIN